MPTAARCSIALLFLVTPSLSNAQDSAFFPTQNQSPLIQIYGLPSLGSARVLSDERLEVSLGLELTNHFFVGNTRTEVLMLDGETHRTVLSLRYGVKSFEWGIEVPYVSHSGGFLDNFIDNWHATFGMPDGGRDQAPANQLTYSYRRNGIDLLQIGRSSRGIGDVRLLSGWSLHKDGPNADLALRASLKLPTGDSATLRGSGGTDVALWLVADCSPRACPGSIGWTAAAGLLALGKGDVLADLQRDVVPFGGAAFSWQAWRPLTLKAQLMAHGRFYDGSQLKPLDANSLQALLGGTWDITPHTALDLAVSEDLSVNSAPDVTLLVSVRSHF